MIDLASECAAPGMHWLEPSAGTGGISDFVPMDAHLTCYEVSDLHCKILEAKGPVENGWDATQCSAWIF